jgi:pimeloyl-ACP methyl ester carboxylesterase
MKRSRVAFSVLVTALTLVFSFGLAQGEDANLQGKYVRVSPDLEIYYEKAGTGDPIIFIPGWTATTSYYQQQLNHFSKNYHAISYDPRSQGRSSKTMENNNYTQHGHDLKAFMDALKLKDVVLVGHSAGCREAWSYFRAYGTENTKAFVCIDHQPKAFIEEEGDWGFELSLPFLTGFYNSLAYDRVNFTREFQKSTVTRPLSAAEVNEFVKEAMMTPTSAAVMLDYDAVMSDYSPEVRMIDKEIPVLYVLADQEGWTEVGQAWLAKNAPNTEVRVLKGSAHRLHWEFPDRFNAVVDSFLEGIE